MTTNRGTFVTTKIYNFTIDDTSVTIDNRRGSSLREVTRLIMNQTWRFLQYPLSIAFTPGPILGPEDHVAPFLSNNRGFCLSDLSRANSESPSQSGADLASRAIYVNPTAFEVATSHNSNPATMAAAREAYYACIEERQRDFDKKFDVVMEKVASLEADIAKHKRVSKRMSNPLFVSIVLEKCRTRLASLLGQSSDISIRKLEVTYRECSSSLQLNAQARAALDDPVVINMLFEHDGFKRLRTEGNVAAHELELEDAQFFLDSAEVPNRRQLTLMVNWFLEASEPVPAI